MGTVPKLFALGPNSNMNTVVKVFRWSYSARNYSLPSTKSKKLSDVHELRRCAQGITYHGTPQPYSTKTDTDALADDMFTEEENSRILKLINESTDYELKARIKIPKNTLDKLVDKRPYSSLTEVLKLPYMTITRLEKMSRRLLALESSPTSDAKENDKRLRRLKYVSPAMDYNTALGISTVTAIDTNYEYTTWVKFDTDLQFKEAFRYEMVTEEKIPISIRKFEPALFVNAVNALVAKLPASDAFILPDRTSKRKSQEKYSLIQQKRQLLDALLTMSLQTRFSQPLIYLVDPALTDSVFNLSVGSERIVTSQILSEIKRSHRLPSHLSGQKNLKGLDLFRVDQSQVSWHNESMNLQFLQCLAFLKEIVEPLKTLALEFTQNTN